jgi:2,4-dienoyl-CoA reductase-like NADH-dependent reductase (Old Yellow Enzyme family)
MSDNVHPAFRPGSIGGLRLRNRILRAGCFEGMCQGGRPTEALVEHHSAVAAGGAALTTVAYCSVSEHGRAYGHEMWMREEILPDLRRLTDGVHAGGAAASIQLGHCGYFSDPALSGGRPLGASRVFNLFRLSWPRPMEAADLARVTGDFARSAKLAVEAGFDAVEVHAGHGYLLSQFLSPYTNRRTDAYGGDVEGRTRFPCEVVRAIRAAVPEGFPILVKMNLYDGFRAGLNATDAPAIAAAFEAAGADAIVPSCGFTSKTPFQMLRGDVPRGPMIRNQPKLWTRVGFALFGHLLVRTYPFEETFLFEDARKVLEAVRIPVVLLGGVCTLAQIERALDAGFGFVQMGRAIVMDPDLPRRMERGEASGSECDHCNRCVAAMDKDGVRCVTRFGWA